MIAEASIGNLLLLLCAGVSAAILTRVAGVILSGHVKPDTPIFEWFACVGQALVGGLMVRAIFLPSNALANVSIFDRGVAVALGFVVFFLAKKRPLAGTAAGVTTLAILLF